MQLEQLVMQVVLKRKQLKLQRRLLLVAL